MIWIAYVIRSSAVAASPAGTGEDAVKLFQPSRSEAMGRNEHMDEPDPLHQNLPSTDEVRKHFAANGWSDSTLSSSFAADIANLAANIEDNIICPCGCSRQNIHDCTCRTAAELRGRILDELAQLGRSGFNLNSADGREQASDRIVRALDQELGSDFVLNNDNNGTTVVTGILFAILTMIFIVTRIRRRHVKRPVIG